jgi:hypothetical protein
MSARATVYNPRNAGRLLVHEQLFAAAEFAASGDVHVSRSRLGVHPGSRRLRWDPGLNGRVQAE